ncbi:acetoacetate decarboxylase [Actinomadura harenae]|uniref:Acetoacetate decarboxylase n=1 Tax=Actinomadura harenae TaxID=2483351 RepID=A0A3M2M2P7_9ACTN|nr:acetoacetate decarboxylase [Actinomadura harenae]RMI43836.1 acetoacetate decarboxylase [Actinomadura harenae]
MKPEDLLRRPVPPLAAPPLTAQPYPLRATRFADREYLNIVYRSDPDALRAAVPEPLEIVEPLVRFEITHMGDVEGFGPCTEAAQVVAVRFGGEDGEYLHAMYLDPVYSVGAVVAGREPSAFPRTVGTPRLLVEEGTLIGTLDHGAQRVATATMPYEYAPMNTGEARDRITVPTFAVRTVPGASGPRACDLVRTEATDVTVKQAWRGPARLQLFEHAMAPLADLPVLEIVSASHVLTDVTLAGAVPVHDYLADRPRSPWGIS